MGSRGTRESNENACALARPLATCPPCQYSCLKVVIYSMTKWLCAIYTGHIIKKFEKTTYFQHGNLDVWPWTLNSFEILSRSIPMPDFRSVAQIVQPLKRWLTDRHTHRTNFIPSTADTGGNKAGSQLQNKPLFDKIGQFSHLIVVQSYSLWVNLKSWRVLQGSLLSVNLT